MGASDSHVFSMRLWFSALILGLVASIGGAQTRSLSDPDALLQDAVARQRNDRSKLDEFTYVELWQNRNFGDKSQQLSNESAKFESIVLHGKPYLRKVEEDGEPLPQDATSQEEQNYDRAIRLRQGSQFRIDLTAAEHEF